jgi:pimeloyl-ACP methyl ester carboxylesterase
MQRSTTLAALPAALVEYRLERRGDATALMFHGGHMRAGLALGEEVFADAGYTILAPSRPGYGRTPLSSGPSVSAFTDITRSLCVSNWGSPRSPRW